MKERLPRQPPAPKRTGERAKRRCEPAPGEIRIMSSVRSRDDAKVDDERLTMIAAKRLRSRGFRASYGSKCAGSRIVGRNETVVKRTRRRWPPRRTIPPQTEPEMPRQHDVIEASETRPERRRSGGGRGDGHARDPAALLCLGAPTCRKRATFAYRTETSIAPTSPTDSENANARVSGTRESFEHVEDRRDRVVLSSRSLEGRPR